MRSDDGSSGFPGASTAAGAKRGCSAAIWAARSRASLMREVVTGWVCR